MILLGVFDSRKRHNEKDIMDPDRLLHLLIKKEEGTITVPEQVELAKLLQEHTAAADIERLVEDIFRAPVRFEDLIPGTDVEPVIERLNQQIHKGQSGQRKSATLKWIALSGVAASFLLLLFLGVGFFLNKDFGKQQATNISTKSKSNIVLPDGSKVWINADTKLSYNPSFGKKTREVIIDGEAYFDVVKDKHRPFIVHTKTVDVVVLGTAFNVRAYQKEESTQTTLIRGSVEVLLKKKNNQRLLLKPYEKIIVRNLPDSLSNKRHLGDKEIPEVVLLKVHQNPVDSGVLETQWVKSKISFDQQKLEDITPMLEKWYNVRIDVQTPVLLKRRFSGRIETESLEEVLESFRLSSGLHYRKNKNVVTLY